MGKPPHQHKANKNTNLGVMLSPATVLQAELRTARTGGHGDQVLLPPPPNVSRLDNLGRPTKAQVDYDTRLADFSKKLAVTQDVNTGRIDNIETTVGNSTVGLVHDLKAVTDGQTALSQQVTTLTAHVNNSDASIIQALTVLTDETKVYAADITTLKGNVGSLSGDITNESHLRINADTALGTRIDNLVVSSGNNAAVIIDAEAQARISADDALGVRIDSVTATISGISSNITNESTARVNADGALANYITRASIASGPVYVQDTDPAATATISNGSVWYKTGVANDPYHPYYRNNGVWADNANGAYGTSTLVAQQITSKVDKSGGLSYEWSVQGVFDSARNGIALRGAKKLNTTTGVVETTAKLIIDADTEINGGLIVNGTIAANKLSATSLSAINANLGTVTAGKLQSSNGKFVIDLDGGTLTISD